MWMSARALKIFLADGASWLIWQLALKKLDTGNSIPVLCYHRVLPDFLETDEPIYTILPEQFEAQMGFLAAEGFVSLSLPEYGEIVRGLRPAPQRSVLITFDDGYADNYRIAWPIAQKYRVKLNLFICPGFVGEPYPIIMTADGYLILQKDQTDVSSPPILGHLQKFPELWRSLGWEELREMRDSGVYVGFHSHSHRFLAQRSSKEIAADLAAGLKMFARRLGYLPEFFALPYGWYDAYTPETIATLNQFGLQYIFGTHFGRAKLPNNQTVMPRLLIYQSDNLATFRRKLSGAYDWLEPVRRLKYLGIGLVGKRWSD
jgi:peptidoglycan/xylan/chitin deacetylase (PgdA/CDA1 family)